MYLQGTACVSLYTQFVVNLCDILYLYFDRRSIFAWSPWTTHSFVVFPGISFVQLYVHLFVLWLCSEQAHCCSCHFVFMTPPPFKTCPLFICVCSFCHAVVHWAHSMLTILSLLHESHCMLYSFLHLCVHLLSCSAQVNRSSVHCFIHSSQTAPPPFLFC